MQVKERTLKKFLSSIHTRIIGVAVILTVLWTIGMTKAGMEISGKEPLIVLAFAMFTVLLYNLRAFRARSHDEESQCD